jgi:hypothetical protein
MGDLPPEAAKLLAAAPADFVPARDRLARELREAGRADDAVAVAGIRKPTAVVLAVNRAARDRPQVARDAADAALRLRETQLSGEPQAYRQVWKELERSLDMLAEVAVAHVAPRGKRPSDAMRRRVHDLLRNAVADDEGRNALVRGVLADEKEAAGFASFAGMTPKSSRRKQAAAKRGRSAAPTQKQRARKKALRDELAGAERELRAAEATVRRAVSARDTAEKAVDAARTRLEQFRRRGAAE